MLRRPKLIETLVTFRNKNKYCEYHKNYRHTTSSVENSRKPSTTEQGMLNHFLRRGRGEDYNCHDPKGKKDNDVDHNTEIIATIIGRIDNKELNAEYQKAHIQKLNQVMIAKELKLLTEPTMMFAPEDMRPLQALQNDILVIHLKITAAIYLKKLQHTKKDLEAINNLIVGFRKQDDRPLMSSELLWHHSSYSSNLNWMMGKDIENKRWQENANIPYEGKKSPLGETSRPRRVRNKVATKVMVVLSTLAEKHERPRESTRSADLKTHHTNVTQSFTPLRLKSLGAKELEYG
ncbi:LOW QUALITY PROTEIN: hypothetical protein Cgig2_006402 [Carnegiea gigantea]|uniref:Uncharacterized protein n=1 Tax=Carnegiea gigantea TaxID=171969 RepID=A0A9Q1K6I9_9CARY|nr:LOW QUALITY PROTEIN: hypothetical protein Cgig2_006402 [Carnegiea gigantea]